MRISLRLKFLALLLPLVLVALLVLVSTVGVYRELMGDIRRMQHQIDVAVMAESFNRLFEKQNEDFLERLVAGKEGEAPGREADRLFDRLANRMAAGAEPVRAEQRYLFKAVRDTFDRSGHARREAAVLASEGAGREAAARIRMDPVFRPDGVLAKDLDRLVSDVESEVRKGLSSLAGRNGTIGTASAVDLTEAVRTLQGEFAMALEAERFAAALIRQSRSCSEAAHFRDADAARRFARAHEKSLEVLTAWKRHVALHPAPDEHRKADAAAVEEIEKEYALANRTGGKVLLLGMQGRRKEAERLRKERFDPLLGVLLGKVDGFALREKKEIAEGLEAVRRRADAAKLDVAAAAFLVLLVGAAGPWLLMAKIVNPVVALKDVALQVGSGRLDAKAEIGSRDELGELAASFNAMTAFIARTTVSKEYLDNIVRAIMSSVVVASPEGTILMVNGATCRMLGYEESELLGRSVDGVLDRVPSLAMKRIENLARSGHVGSDETVYRAKDGREIPVIFSGATVTTAEGGVSAIVCVAQDIADRLEAEEALENTNEKLKVWVYELELRNREITLLNKLGDTLQTCLTVDEAYKCVALSATELFPGSSGLVGVIHSSRNLVEAVSAWGPAVKGGALFPPDECWALRRGRLHQLEPGGTSLPCPHIGDKVPERSLCVPMVAQGETIGMIHVQLKKEAQPPAPEAAEYLAESDRRLATTLSGNVALALTNLRLRATLREQVTRDVLTGLFNRRYMEETLVREVTRARRAKCSIGIIMLDIDHFKRFNDTFGHAAGDAVLREFGNFLKRKVRGSDIPCRYGGEEFALVLPEAPNEITVRRAEQLCDEIPRSLVLEHQGQTLGTITASLGVAFFPDHGDDGDQVLRAADAALYRAKGEGRNRVCVAPPVSAVAASPVAT